MRGPQWTLYGVEMSENIARQAEAASGAQIFVGDMLDAPFAPGSIDAITCFHVLEHVYQPRAVLAKVAQWLKPGGVFYTMMPNIDSAGARMFRSYWYALELPRHLYHFSPPALRGLACSEGLEEVGLTTHRELFIEPSLRYLLDGAFAKLEIKRTPLAQSKPASLPWKMFRKGLRLTLWQILAAVASLAGDGESIHAVFIKPFRR